MDSNEAAHGNRVVSVDLREAYRSYAECVVGVETADSDGKVAIGTAFHIGDGFYLTARHVIENRVIADIVFERAAARFTAIFSASFPSDPQIDLALLSTDLEWRTSFGSRQFEDEDLVPADVNPAITLGGHLDDWINDSLVLMPILLMGFPPVPTSRGPVLLAVTGEVNAVVDTYWSTHPKFVVSSTARGGFSGGPVITEQGWLLGVLTESLDQGATPGEPGFAVALSVEPIFRLLSELKVAPRANRAMCYLLDPGNDAELAYFADLLPSNELRALREWKRAPAGKEPSLQGQPCQPIRRGKPIWKADSPLQGAK